MWHPFHFVQVELTRVIYLNQLASWYNVVRPHKNLNGLTPLGA
jgi:hypothetical protein